MDSQALEEAEQQLQRERTELEGLLIAQARLRATESVGEEEEARLFHVQRDCRMASIVQDALYKQEQVLSLLAER